MDSRPAATRIPRSNDRAGQGLLEFALVVPILLLLVIGALDFGFAFYTKVQLVNSAREGAYYMVYHNADSDALDMAKVAVQNEAQGSGVSIALSDIVVQGLPGPGCASGGSSTVVVTVSHPMGLPVDIFGTGPLQLASEARMRIP